MVVFPPIIGLYHLTPVVVFIGRRSIHEIVALTVGFAAALIPLIALLLSKSTTPTFQEVHHEIARDAGHLPFHRPSDFSRSPRR
jgi:hypothetical protein